MQAAAAATTAKTAAAAAAAGAASGAGAKSLANDVKIKLSADEMELLDCHELVPDHGVTLSISKTGFISHN